MPTLAGDNKRRRRCRFGYLGRSAIAMITVTSNADSPLTANAAVRGLAIYLGNWRFSLIVVAAKLVYGL